MKVLTRVRAASQRARRESVRRRRWKRELARAVERIAAMAQRYAADLGALDLAAWREFTALPARHFRVHDDGTLEEIPEPTPAPVTGRVVEVTETTMTIETCP